MRGPESTENRKEQRRGKKRMLECISFKSSSSSSAYPPVPHRPHPSQGTSTEQTPISSGQSSPAPIVSREYKNVVGGSSYKEIQSKIQDHVQLVNGYDLEDSNSKFLEHVLQPDRKCVEEALGHAKPSTLKSLVSEYFNHSQTTCELCLKLLQRVSHARQMYDPVVVLLDVLPIDSESITQSQCDRAFDVFLKFDSQDNPFLSPETQIFNNMRSCFTELRQQLDRRLQKSRSRLRFIRRATAGSAICFIVTAVGVVVSAVAVTTHAIVAFVAAGPVCTAHIPHPKTAENKERARLAQLNAAAKGTFGLKNDLDTIDGLVARLQTAFDADKGLIRLGLVRGREKHPIQEVIKHLRKNYRNFFDLLKDLDEHIFICFNAVNKARMQLLQEIHLYQTL